MRLRNVKGSRETIERSPFVIKDTKKHKGNWKEVFSNNHPIHIEIGMGKGKFITTLASLNPEINYIGIEKFSSVLVRAIEKQAEIELPNLKFIRMEAEEICEVFEEEEISRIYLNFSDPWPKDRHAKRRLTSRQFLERYAFILTKDGRIEFKTDNIDLFEFSLKEVEFSKFKRKTVTYDLHKSDLAEGNIMTEYEERFSSMGNPIHKLILERSPISSAVTG